MLHNKKVIVSLLLFSLLTCFLNCRASAESFATGEPVYLPILMYHEVKPQKPGKDAILPSEFESDLRYLTENGYTTVTISDLIDYVYLGEPLPDKPVMLSFDDGYYNNYVHVLPLLKQYNMKIVFSIIGKNADDFSQYPSTNIDYAHATWEQVNEMLDSGLVEIQNHSYDLHKYTDTQHGCLQTSGESDADYAKRLTDDAAALQEDILRMTGRLPAAFTYPYGKYSACSEALLEEMGFLATLSCDYGVNAITHDPQCLFCLKRICRSHNQEIGKLIAGAMKTIK